MVAARRRVYERAEHVAVVALAVGMGAVTLVVGVALRALEQEIRRAEELRHERLRADG